MRKLSSRLKKVAPLALLSTLLLVSFQNCRQNSGVNSSKTSSTDPNANSTGTPDGGTGSGTGGSGAGSSTPTPSPTPSSTPPPNPCPASAMTNPEMSELFVAGTSTVATSVMTYSGYANNGGNVSSSPEIEVSLLNTGVTPVDVCDQNATVTCTIAVNPGSTGMLWGTGTRVPITKDDLECVAASRNLDLDVPGRTPTARPSKTTLRIRPKEQMPDLAATTHVCMEGSATVTVSLKSTYNKNSSARSFTVQLTNACPREQKVNAGAYAEAQGLFGEALSLSGSRAATLSTGLNAYEMINVGGAHIFEKSGESWQLISTVVPPQAELEADKKPASVLLSGDNLWIGNTAINGNSGRVWLFQRDGTGAWNKAQTLNGTSASKFGAALAFNGTHLFVGSTAGNGSVQIYSLNSSTLTLVGSVSGADSGADFGASLAVSGSRMLIGAPGSAINTTTTGHFYSCDIANLSAPTCSKWTLTGGLLGGEAIPASSKLGSRVALNGSMALISAEGWYPATMEVAPAIRHGLVAIMDLTTGASSIKILKGGVEEFFGSSIGFATTSFFVGVKEGLGKRGYVDQFNMPVGTAVPTRKFRYYAVDQAPQDRFGTTLAISGNQLLVGAPLDQEGSFSTAGSATFFNILSP